MFVRGIEAYSFSTPFGWLISHTHNPTQKLFDSSRNMLPAYFFTRKRKKTLMGLFSLCG
jgi:hypothetical protein